ncbi:MAG: response regulator [Bauldia sp.]|nr:response regulator [Bauldia sp.]
MRDAPLILVVDDGADDREILQRRLESQGYRVATAPDGEAALGWLAANDADLVLLDVMMPRLDGIATLRRLRAERGTAFVPVIMLTGKGAVADVVEGLDAGADEYLVKPVDHAALVARVKAMLRLKAMHDEIAGQAARLAIQAAELSALNQSLETRVAEQVAEIERMRRLKRFLAPQVADAVLASPDGEAALESHRREVAVLFTDLRGFTALAESNDPEDVIALLREYHALVGDRVFAHGGTLERFAGDAIMVLFNDPMPQPGYCLAAARLGLDIAGRAEPLTDRWRARGFRLGIGIGIASGFATLGKIGFGDRFDYAAIGTVTNLAARLSTQAEAGQVLASARVAEAIAAEIETRALGEVDLKGFARPVPVFELPQARG